MPMPMGQYVFGATVDDLGKRDYAALLSSRPTGSFRATPPPRLLHHILGRAPHRAGIMRKLNISSPAALVRYAVRNKLVEP